jgi:uncharacterized protein with PQ loop repeat
MPLIVQILYIVASIVSIGAGIPQLRKLLLTKRTDEFSVPTWTTWTSTQAVSLLYSFYLGDLYFTMVCAIWLAFDGLMMVVILKYRRNSPASVAVEVDQS